MNQSWFGIEKKEDHTGRGTCTFKMGGGKEPAVLQGLKKVSVAAASGVTGRGYELGLDTN